MKATTPRKEGVSKELANQWRYAVRTILKQLGYRQEDLAKECGISRQALATMLNREDMHLTVIQFLGTTQALREMTIRRAGTEEGLGMDCLQTWGVIVELQKAYKKERGR